MYVCGWIHSWTCGSCSDADVYWRLRAFWAGVKGKRSVLIVRQNVARAVICGW